MSYMSKTHKLLSISILALLALTGCDAGDNQQWEAKLYKGVPYTDERTAGTGYKWVLVALAPRKGAVLDPMMEESKQILPAQKVSDYIPTDYEQATAISEPELNDATPIFDRQMMGKK